jgi:hypothetical protein
MPSKLGLGPGLQGPRAHALADNTYALVIEALDHPGSNLLVGHPFDVPKPFTENSYAQESAGRKRTPRRAASSLSPSPGGMLERIAAIRENLPQSRCRLRPIT